MLWAPQWRPDQKEPPLREAAAERGMALYFQALPCANQVRIHRLNQDEAQTQLTADQALALARTKGDAPDKVVLLRVRELGPKLRIGLPTLVEGGTEVVLEAHVVQAQPASTLATRRMHWQKGGPFYIKGVKSLDDLGDLASDELREIVGESAMDAETANAIIMKAREHWFPAEEATAAEPAKA